MPSMLVTLDVSQCPGHIADSGSIPFAERLVEARGFAKHARNGFDFRDVPGFQRLIEVAASAEQRFHIRD